MDPQEYEDMFHSEELMWWYIGLRDVLNYYISQHGKKLKILDAGCGTGKNMQFLKDKGYNVFGIDISKEAFAFCKKRGLKNVQVAPVDKIPFGNSLFEVVISTDVLGAFRTEKEAKKVLAEFYRVLRPGGQLVLHCSALPWLHSPHDITTQIVKRYTKTKLLNLLGEKWIIEKASYRIFFLFLPVIVIKLVKEYFPGLNLSKTDQYHPPGIINTVLTSIQLFENLLLRFIDFPWGSSILIVGSKKS